MTAVGLAISWMVRDSLLLIFAGLLFASFLDAMTDLLGKAISWPRGVRLSIVCAIIAATLLAFAAWGGATIAMQGQELAENLQDQINHLLAWLSDLGLKVSPASRSGLGTPKIPNAEPTIRSILPDISVLFGQAWTAVGVLLGAVGDALAIIIIGLFVAIRPAVYLNAGLFCRRQKYDLAEALSRN